jgi:hypothetical protein
MLAFGAGAWGSSNGTVVEKDIKLDGRLYNRIRFDMKLTPGFNPVQLTASAFVQKGFVIERTSETPSAIGLTEQGQLFISFTDPVSGYVKVKPGSSIPVAGSLVKDNPSPDSDGLHISVLQYAEGNYKEISQADIPIKDGKFAGSFSIKNAGEYWIHVWSPRYIPYTEEPYLLAETWAMFKVKVEA